MKVYTNTFDAVAPTPNRFWVPPYSDFGIGIKILGKDGQALSGVTLSADGEALSAEADKIDGFTIFNTASQGQGAKVYTAKAADLGTPFRLVQVVTDSTVFDKGGSGGSVPADVATKTWVNEQISDFVDEDTLTAYATTDSLTAYAETDDLTAYAEKSELTAYATTDSLSGKVNAASEGNAPLPSTMKSVYETAWSTLSANPDANTFYVVLPDPV